MSGSNATGAVWAVLKRRIDTIATLMIHILILISVISPQDDYNAR